MKIAVSGKGGVGKTTLSAMLAGALAIKGRKVIAVDADPDANLAAALGVPPQEPITPLAEMKQLIEERTGSAAGYGGYFKLNPKVDDIPDEYGRKIADIRLLVMGGVSGGGDGCICPATALLKALLVHLIMGSDDALIMDMEAGIEHLGRATAESMDALVIVVDGGPWSVQTAQRVTKLAGDLKMKNVFAVANRVTNASALDLIRESLGDIPLVGYLPVDDRLAEAMVSIDSEGNIQPSEGLAGHLQAVESILAEIESRV